MLLESWKEEKRAILMLNYYSLLSLQQIDSAQTGQDICIKIEHAGGDAPKLYGRHFDENDVLVSRVCALIWSCQ